MPNGRPHPVPAATATRGRLHGIADALRLLAIVALVAVTGFFVALEFALVAVDRPRLAALRRRGRPAGAAGRSGCCRTSLQPRRHPARDHGGVARPRLHRRADRGRAARAGARPRAPSIAIAARASPPSFQMVVGELVPKSLAIARPERAARLLAPAAVAYGRLFGFAHPLFRNAANRAVRRLGIEPTEELHVGALPRGARVPHPVVGGGGHAGARGVLGAAPGPAVRGEDRRRRPRPAHRRACRVPADATVADLVERAVETGRSRFPVCGVDLDDVVGVVHVKDVYRLPYASGRDRPVTDIAQPAWVVPETADLADLLLEFRRVGTHLAVVVDEYGGTAGILTLEDVLEELVGEIDDEHDVPTAAVRGAADGHPRAAGHAAPRRGRRGVRLRDARRALRDARRVRRSTGSGRIPEPGERFDVDGWRLEVAEMDRLRVASVRLTRAVIVWLLLLGVGGAARWRTRSSWPSSSSLVASRRTALEPLAERATAGRSARLGFTRHLNVQLAGLPARHHHGLARPRCGGRAGGGVASSSRASRSFGDVPEGVRAGRRGRGGAVDRGVRPHGRRARWCPRTSPSPRRSARCWRCRGPNRTYVAVFRPVIRLLNALANGIVAAARRRAARRAVHDAHGRRALAAPRREPARAASSRRRRTTCSPAPSISGAATSA